MWQKLVGLAIAGACGSLLRYGLGGLVQRFHVGVFPWGTLTVNVLGCLLFGLAWSLLEGRVALSPETRTVLLVGFLGAFTTFSTFVFETDQLLGDAQWLLASLNVVGGLALGLAAYRLGTLLGRLL